MRPSLTTPRRCALAFVLGGFLIAGSAHADYQLFDDFSDETLGLINGQDNWASYGGANAVVNDPADPLNQCLYVPSESSVIRKALSAAALSFPDGTQRMFFFRMRVATKQTFSVGLSPYTSPSEYSDFAAELGMANSTPNLDLRAWDDDGGNYEPLIQLTPDTWYNVWVAIDAAANHYTVWLNDVPDAAAGPADLLVAYDGDVTFDFRTGDNSPMQTFYIKTSGGSSGFGPAHFDDLYLESAAGLMLMNPLRVDVGDCDGSGVFDAGDLGALDTCLSGPDIDAPGCTCLQIDADADVDLHDVALLQDSI